jgi:predicted HicB family RNase H-like nuclease
MAKKKKTDYTSIIDGYKEEMKQQTGRPKKQASEGRVKLTTSINESLIKKAKIKAVTLGITLADLIEDLLRKDLK